MSIMDALDYGFGGPCSLARATLLREEPRRFSQIVKETKIPKKTVNRILNEFHRLGIAGKNNEGQWSWHEYLTKFNSLAEYDLTLKHSSKLIRGLNALLMDLPPTTSQKRALAGFEYVCETKSLLFFRKSK